MERARELSRVVGVIMAGALTGALLIPVMARPAAAASAVCRSSSHPALAARITSPIVAAPDRFSRACHGSGSVAPQTPQQLVKQLMIDWLFL